jgi:deoxyhypusine synthase
VSWGKIDPDNLPDAVVCYSDTTIALPILTAYILTRADKRPLKRLADRRVALMDRLKSEYASRGRLSGAPTTSRDVAKRGITVGMPERTQGEAWPCGTPKK